MHNEIPIAVIHNVLPFINGGLFDAYEYFSALYEYSKGKSFLFLVYQNYQRKDLGNNYLENVFEMFDDKYINLNIVKNNIFFITSSKLIRYRFNKVLFLDSHSPWMVRNRVIAKEKYYLVDPFEGTDTNYKKISKENNTFIFSEPLYYHLNGDQKDD